MQQEPSWLGAAGHCRQVCAVSLPLPSSPASCPGSIRLAARSPAGGTPPTAPMAPRPPHPTASPRLHPARPEHPGSPGPPAPAPPYLSGAWPGTARGRALLPGTEPRCRQHRARAAPARAEPLSGGGAGLQPAPGAAWVWVWCGVCMCECECGTSIPGAASAAHPQHPPSPKMRPPAALESAPVHGIIKS